MYKDEKYPPRTYKHDAEDADCRDEIKEHVADKHDRLHFERRRRDGHAAHHKACENQAKASAHQSNTTNSGDK
jgi:hypothetical protein